MISSEEARTGNKVGIEIHVLIPFFLILIWQ